MIKKYIIIALVIVVLLGVGYQFATNDDSEDTINPDIDKQELKIVGQKTYSGGNYGITFPYSDKYSLSESSRDGEGENNQIVLTSQDFLPSLEDDKSAPAITFDIYPRGYYATITEWLQKAPESNFVLVTGEVNQAVLDDKEALYYHWTGLRQAESVLVMHKDNIISITVTYDTPEDEIRNAFISILDSLRLE